MTLINDNPGSLERVDGNITQQNQARMCCGENATEYLLIKKYMGVLFGTTCGVTVGCPCPDRRGAYWMPSPVREKNRL